MRARSSKPIELHGNIMRNRCLICSEIYTEIKLNEDKRIPQHAECNGMLRPDVVWFGENLPQQALSEADEAINSAEVFLSVGTSAQVQPAASMPLWAKNRGAYIVEINIEETLLTPYADEFIQEKSGEILPELLKSVSS